MSDTIKVNKIIPVGKAQFAYQQENLSLVLKLVGDTPNQFGSQPYENEEKELLRGYHPYELELLRHTGNSMVVSFRKFFDDGKVELFTLTMSYSDFINQLFNNVECSKIIEKESAPKADKERLSNHLRNFIKSSANDTIQNDLAKKLLESIQ